ATYDRTNNIQFWGIYSLPFGPGQKFANSGKAGAILGGFQLNGQLSHISGTPFTVGTAGAAINAPGNPLYANLVRPFHQIGGHNRTPGNTNVSGGNPWFDPSSFAVPSQPSACIAGDPGCTAPNGDANAPAAFPVFGNTHRNQFRGPGQTVINASV